MNFLSWISDIWKLLSKKELKNPKKIAILFFKNLGIGDLVMLSPAIQKISDIFPNSEIFLISWVPEIIKFKNISLISIDEFKKRKKEFEMIISPTLCLRHWQYIFSSKYWIGYFSIPKIQSNFSDKKYSYSLSKDHYLIRGINLIKAMNKEKGGEMEKKAEEKMIEYPDLILKEPIYFKKELLNKKYLAIAPVSKPFKQWGIDKFSEIIKYVFYNKKIKNIVFLGDKSEYNQKYINEIIKNSRDIPEINILNTAGKNTLLESIFIIKNSEIFIGLDSAPAHFAYLLAKRVLAIFIGVDYQNIKPMKLFNNNNIQFIYSNVKNNYYSGILLPKPDKFKKIADCISIESVKKAIDELLK